MLDLFDPNRGALTEAERKRLRRQAGSKPRGHAWKPGTGPEGETCKTCVHLVRLVTSRTYLKCGRNRAGWTKGPGSDIRARDAACKFWEAGARP